MKIADLEKEIKIRKLKCIETEKIIDLIRGQSKEIQQLDGLLSQAMQLLSILALADTFVVNRLNKSTATTFRSIIINCLVIIDISQPSGFEPDSFAGSVDLSIGKTTEPAHESCLKLDDNDSFTLRKQWKQ